MTRLTPGVYDDLIDLLLSEGLDRLQEEDLYAHLTDVDPSDIPKRVAEVVGAWVVRALGHLPEKDRRDGAIDHAHSQL